MVKISKDMLINALQQQERVLRRQQPFMDLMQRSLSRRSMIILQKRRLSSILAKVTRCTIKDGEIYEDRRNKSSRAGNIWTDRY